MKKFCRQAIRNRVLQKVRVFVILILVVSGINLLLRSVFEMHVNKYEYNTLTTDTLQRSSSETDLLDNFSYKKTSLNSVANKKAFKTILWYEWDTIGMVAKAHRITFSVCEFKRCQIKIFSRKVIGEPKRPLDADAIIVQSNGISKTPPPPRRDKNQVFIFAVRDAFIAMKKSEKNDVSKRWFSVFNWTMTYRTDSDIYTPYSYILPRGNKDKELKSKDYEAIYERKRHDAVWLVSHCITKSHREDYVRDLKEVINVTIFGDCGEKAPCPKPKRTCFDEVASQYKFYLAFENNFVNGYVTEKLFDWFPRDIIVVVRGGANYSEIAPEGTIIDAADFSSPRELGKALKALAVNKQKYISFLKRKDRFNTIGQARAAQKAYCKMCEFLHNLDSHRNSYSNIQEWWENGRKDSTVDFIE